jgi:hypothetical protein
MIVQKLVIIQDGETRNYSIVAVLSDASSKIVSGDIPAIRIDRVSNKLHTTPIFLTDDQILTDRFVGRPFHQVQAELMDLLIEAKEKPTHE